MIERVRGAYVGRNREWIGADPRNWPQRACSGVDLEGGTLIEVTVTAVRESNDING